MAELLFILFLTFLVLGLITLVGHGIWTLLALIFGRPARPAKPQAAAKKEEEPVEPIAAEVVEEPQTAPRKSLGEMLAAFMEERNMRWGELIGGLLIVGSSVALVLSLWDTLREIRYFPPLIFVAISSAVFGLGLYAYHRWKLESTSRGLLIIATLLVPLNFLAMAGLFREQWTLPTLVLELAFLGIFAWLVGLAARVLVPQGRWPAVLAVVGNSALVPVAGRLVGVGGSPWSLVAMSCLPVAVFGAAGVSYLLATSGKKRFDASDAGGLLTLLGTGCFALAVVLGLLVWQGVNAVGLSITLDCLSVPLALAAVPIMAGGLRIMRGMIDDGTLEAYRTTGMAVALIAVALKVTALCLVWPQPLGIMVVGGLNFAGLMFVAFRFRLPVAHAPAMACLALAYLAGFHVIYSHLPPLSNTEALGPRMLKLMVGGASGTALAGLFVVLAGISELLARRGRRRHAAMYTSGAAGAAVVGLMIVTAHGIHGSGADAIRAAVLYAGYGAVSLLFAARWRKAELSYLGLGLVVVAATWALWAHTECVGPLWAVVFAAEALAMALLAAVLSRCFGHEPSAAWDPAQRASQSGRLTDLYRIPLVHLAEILAPAAAALALECELFGLRYPSDGQLHWIALATAAAAVTILLWDRWSRFALAGLYFVGLSAIGMQLCVRDLSPRESCWRATCDLAGFVLAAAVVGWLLPRLKPLWRALKIPDRDRPWPIGWFMHAQAILVVVGVVLAAWGSIDFQFDGVGDRVALFGLSGRLSGWAGALILLGAAIVMAWQTKQTWRTGWQYAALGLAVLLNSCLGWAGVDPTAGTPTGDAPWLHRSVHLMVAAAMITLLSGFGLRLVLSKTSDWIAAGRRMVPVLGSLALFVLVLVLAQEAFLFDPKDGTPMTTSAVLIVTVALAGLVAACLGFALRADWDPLDLNDRGRTAYVYAAEVLGVLTGLHLWFTMPELFRLGIFEKYWMLIVMAVAFCVAGLSELFHRRKMPILSEPFERTALLLPLAPAIGFWFAHAPESALGLLGSTPVLWLLMGLFYGVMAVSKRSVGCAALAVLTLNTGLWVALHRFGPSFFEHPQLWLIPVALVVLVAEYLNHHRLDETQSTAMRYIALAVIYISSTADIFIAGVGEDWKLPLVLMLLSVAGVLAGIMLRVRSFLLLGVTFLVLDMITIIRYAAVDLGHKWILYVCGIALGAAIICLFAFFEKRRNDVLAAVERFKEWEG